MIRVALSTSVIQRGKSGVASYVFGLIEGLLATGAPLQLSLIGFSEDKPLFNRWLDRCQWISVAEDFRPAVRDILWHATKLRGILRRERAEILHIPSYRRIVPKPPVPQVVTIHDCAAFRVRGKYDIARMIYGKHVVRQLARQADVVSTVSHSTARDVEQFFGIKEADVHVIWNGIDHAAFHPFSPDGIATAMKRLGQQRPYFIYLARLEHPAKNHVRLIEAFEAFCARNPDCAEELLFGGADWHGAEVVHARIASSSHKDRIRCLGFIPKDDLGFWYAGATAMVYPSLFEGFGLPPVEAMACGCPVICSAAGSLGEVAGDAAYVIDPLAPETLTAAMESVALQPGKADAWRKAGIAQAAKFTWAAAASSMYKLYEGARSARMASQ